MKNTEYFKTDYSALWKLSKQQETQRVDPICVNS